MTKKRAPIVAAAVLVAAAAAALVLVRRVGPDFARLRGGRDYSVILITVDTLRADKVGCYGNAVVSTPGMDGLAARGVRFANCIAQTPLTLPSHTTIMTGTTPAFHGVRDNGGFVVPPELLTMAEAFQSAGYETAAFVAAYVLDSKWGLGQGFDTYFDKFDLSRFEKISLGEVQRPADEVVDEAIAWLDKRAGGKFFAWIHLYDPHSPYAPPEPFKSEYPHPYLGEIAFTDSQLGRLWDRLGQMGLRDGLFLVLASDHGEKLPREPNSKALEEFLIRQKTTDPLSFPDLSLTVIKLLGNGEYVAELPEGDTLGHFGLAVKDYAHSTAPNRRYVDLLTQRLVKAALEGQPVPYSMDELDRFATHCTEAEDAVNKVERQVEKSAAALLLERFRRQFALEAPVNERERDVLGTHAEIVQDRNLSRK